MEILLRLKQRGYYSTATLRENMLPKSCHHQLADILELRTEKLIYLVHIQSPDTTLVWVELTEWTKMLKLTEPETKKGWFSIFTWLIDVSIQNVWLLHRKSGSMLSHI